MTGLHVGYFSSYLPPELIWACGSVPVRLRPGNRLAAADGYLPRNFSVEARALLASALDNELAVDAVVFLDEDDTGRRLLDVWRAYTKIPALGPAPLPRLATSAACARYARALVELAAPLAGLADRTCRPADLLQATELYNEQRRLWRDLRTFWVAGALATEAWHDLRWLALSAAPEAANGELAEAVTRLAGTLGSPGQGRRLAVLGAMDVLRQVLVFLEACGARVVAEDSEAGERTLTTPIPTDGDPYEALAAAYLNKPPGPRPAAFSQRLAFLERLVEERRVEGVIAFYPKFADPYLAEYPALADALAGRGLPTLLVEQDRESGFAGQQRTRVEAFLEILG